MSNALEIRYCRQCEKQLYGRVDQVYCNDSCRNAFNKQKAKQNKLPPHPNQKAIFKIIQRNYELLKRARPSSIPDWANERVPKVWLKEFRPNFFTGMVINQQGTWFICFDRGWMDDGTHWVLKDFPDKADV